MNRLRAAVFSLLVALAVGRAGVLAQSAPPAFWFAGTRLIFVHAAPLEGDVAVPVDDPGLVRLLARLGATLSYSPQERYIIVTAADRRTIAFALASTQYTAGGVTARAAFAPYLDGNRAVIPLYALAHALYVEPVVAGNETVLQPQLGALDVRTAGKRTTVVLRAATQLAYVTRVDAPGHLELAFSGVASPLAQTRTFGDLTVTVTSGGTAKNPTTIVAFDTPRSAQHELLPPATPFDVGVAFSGLGASVGAAPVPAPLPSPTPAPSPTLAAPPLGAGPPPPPIPAPLASSAAPNAVATETPPPGVAPPLASAQPAATVTGVVLTPADDGLTVRIVVNGAPLYDWHRLADHRWYIDLHDAMLTDAGRDEHPAVAAVESVRIRQIGTPDAPAVRIALTLRGDRRVDLTPSSDGLTIVATNVDTLVAVRSGSGRAGTGGDVAVAPSPPPSVAPDFGATPVPGAPLGSAPWKFAPAVNGSRIIVLDPGHGGSDIGTAHNGLVEKSITIDIARRLRALLVAQGWSVRMTRDDDVDPVSSSNLALMAGDGKPNPTDRAYLQTRCDVANNVNARLFISIHVNYSESASVNGTTFYWYKPQDQTLATTLERAVIPVTGTNDVGPRHENFYVIRHTTMPAVLIETAFISNPHDAALLGSPSFLQSMAQGIANGVKAYAGLPPLDASRADQ
jgi:N-acetylmuramoyl-L-alanine amidase